MFKNIFKFFLLFLLVFVVASCEEVPTDGPGQGTGSGTGTEDTYEYVTPETDALKLSAEWEGKDFIEDGIGEVTVSQYVDGDTTNFKTKNGFTFTARYLGINTPESTYKVEPWGFAASKYTKQQLKAAHKIVLQCDDINDRVDSTGERYLAWVWLIDEAGDSRLLNLELVEVALAKSKANDTSLAEVFNKAVYDVTINRCRIYGYNNDKDYDYSKESKAMSLKEIRETYGTPEALKNELDKGKKVVVSGVVTRLNGLTACYIQQYDVDSNEYYGIYVYGGYTTQSAFKVGNSIVIEGKIGYYNGSLQITDVNAKVKSFAPSNTDDLIYVNEVEDKSIITYDNYAIMGSLVKVTDLKVTGGDDADSNAFTIYTSYVDKNGVTRKLDVRVDNNTNLVGPDGERITSYQYFSGKTIKELVAQVSYFDYNVDDNYDGYVQLMLSSLNDIVLE